MTACYSESSNPLLITCHYNTLNFNKLRTTNQSHTCIGHCNDHCNDQITMNVIKQFICVADTVKSGLSCVLKVDDIKDTNDSSDNISNDISSNIKDSSEDKVAKINDVNIEYNTPRRNTTNCDDATVYQILKLSVTEATISKLPEPEREFVEMSIAVADTVSNELYKNNIWTQTN